MCNNSKNSKEHQDILDFINETKEGVYTDAKPDLAHISYSRIEIPIFEPIPFLEEEPILYGLSY